MLSPRMADLMDVVRIDDVVGVPESEEKSSAPTILDAAPGTIEVM